MGKVIFDRRHQKWLEVEELKPARGANITILQRQVKRNRKFAMVPLLWRNRLAAKPRASATTYDVAIYILYLDWKENMKLFSGQPFKLPNKSAGISPRSKWRALADLERRNLIMVERRPSRSPLIRLLPLN